MPESQNFFFLLSNNPKFFVVQEVLTHKIKAIGLMVVAMVTTGLDYSIIHLY